MSELDQLHATRSTHVTPAIEPPNKINAGDRDQGCQCWYEILSGSYGETGENYAEICFFSNTECIPGNPFSCVYFTAKYWSSGDTCGTFNIPGCGDIWSEFPPSGSFNFECIVPKYTSFDAILYSNIYGDQCNGIDYLNSQITFRIGCAETCENYSYIAYSEPVTLNFAPGTPFSNNTTLINLWKLWLHSILDRVNLAVG